jgi:putative redox protein
MGAVQIELQSGMHFEAKGEEGFTIALDSDPAHGGENLGFRPMELLLAGLGSCTAMDVISILRKKRQDVTAYRVVVDGRQADDYPRVFTDITIRHILHGTELREDAVRRSIELSEQKYCPAYAMLSETARITSTFEILPDEPAD